MAVGTSVKQIVWKLFIGEEYMDLPTAGAVAAFNTVLNSANNLLAICQATGVSFGKGEGNTWDDFPYPPLVAGGALFVAGMLIETLSEVQRKAFKADKETAGKPCTTGLWALSRHINYFGYTLWRAGFALSAGGWLWGSANAAFFLWDFGTRGCPMLDKYLEVCLDGVSQCKIHPTDLISSRIDTQTCKRCEHETRTLLTCFL